MSELGKILLLFGIAMVVLGLVLLAAGTISGKAPWLGRLPGDIHIERDGVHIYLPLGTSLLLSAVLTLVLMLLRR
jgi:hypothetical protein